MARSTPATIVETAGAPTSRVPPGRLVLTPAALRLLRQAYARLEEDVCRHVQGDWDTVPPGLWAMNQIAPAAGAPLGAATACVAAGCTS
jgi:hypothetical protein